MDKVCTKCNESKPLDRFNKCSVVKSGYRGACKDCHNSYYRNRRITNHEQVRSYEKKFHTRRRLKYEYGITEEDYTNMLSKQNSSCAVCGNNNVKLVVDHCHTTGKVRGLLCNQCNLGLGHFKDSHELIEKAIHYLKDKYGQ